MSDLATFLLDRIAEDEAAARAAEVASKYEWSDNAFTEAVELADNEGALEAATKHIARHDPARVLAECEAKRKIVERREELEGMVRAVLEATQVVPPAADEQAAVDFAVTGVRGGIVTCDDILRRLALPYANHPDYRDEWRP